MTEINLASNTIGDDGFAGAMYYVSKDQAMRSLYLQANEVTVSQPSCQPEMSGNCLVPAQRAHASQGLASALVLFAAPACVVLRVAAGARDIERK